MENKIKVGLVGAGAVAQIGYLPVIAEREDLILEAVSESNREKVASVTWQQVQQIAQDKMPDLNAFTVRSAMQMVAGTARSMGITVQGDFPSNL